MKAEVKIPDGWRRLRRGEKIQRGDKFDFKPGRPFSSGKWDWVKFSIGSTPAEWGEIIFIRRKAKKARKP